MMINIPPQQTRVLADLAGLSTETRSRFLVALGKAERFVRVERLAESISDEVGLPAQSLSRYIYFLGNIYLSKLALKMSAAQVTEEMSGALKLMGSETDKRLSERQTKDLLDFIHAVVSLDQGFGLVIKAADVLMEQENIFVGCRVLTDVRPIFSNDSKPVPAAAIVYHNLRLTFGQKQSHEETNIILALDRNDMEELKTAVNRALEKEDQITSLYGQVTNMMVT